MPMKKFQYIRVIHTTMPMKKLQHIPSKKKNVELNLMFISQANNIGNSEIPVFALRYLSYTAESFPFNYMLKSKLSLSRHFEYANKQITYHFWLCFA
jgi:hypothetical protein